jgi:UDP-GlcNAc:undecaprenyl-phosphate GlcNAc-1-phosphate transferase
MDTLLAVVRRIISQRSVFSPDRSHIHHRLIEMGLTHRRAVLLMYGISVLFTGAAIVVYLGREWQVGLTLFVATVVVVALVRAMRLFQFRSIRRLQRAGRYDTDTDRIRAALPELIGEARGAVDAAALHTALRRFAESAGLVMVRVIDADGQDWDWEASEQRENRRHKTRGYVSATYEIETVVGAPGTVKFGWFSESGDVSPQSEVLLRTAAEEVQRQLSRLAGRASNLQSMGGS